MRDKTTTELCREILTKIDTIREQLYAVLRDIDDVSDTVSIEDTRKASHSAITRVESRAKTVRM